MEESMLCKRCKLYLIKGSVLCNILNDNKRKVLFGGVRMRLKDSSTFRFGSDCDNRLEPVTMHIRYVSLEIPIGICILIPSSFFFLRKSSKEY